MSKFWSPMVAGLKPYVAGEQPRMANLVKLNTNENPRGPSPKVLQAIRAAATDDLRRYPDPSALALRETIARYCSVGADEVFVGNGSDEVLAFVFASLLRHDRPLLYPDITYSFYPTYSQLFEIQTVQIPLADDFTVRPEDYRIACGGIIIANPNAPTGIAMPLAQIEQLLIEHPDQVVVIDEAYVDFGADSAVSLVPRHDNLLVVQTFSKSRSLAGMRIGFAIGQRPLIEALERMKDSFNSYPLDMLAQAAGVAAIEDEAWFQSCRREVMDNRAMLTSELSARGFDVLPSSANFVFARHRQRDGAELAKGLRDHAVIVRHFAKPRISQFLRITIGTSEECRRLLDALDRIL